MSKTNNKNIEVKAENSHKKDILIAVVMIVFLFVFCIGYLVLESVMSWKNLFYPELAFRTIVLAVVIAILVTLVVITVKSPNKADSLILSITCAIVLIMMMFASAPYFVDLIRGSVSVTTSQFTILGKRSNIQIQFEDSNGEQTTVYITSDMKEDIESKTHINMNNYANEKFLNNYDKSITIEYFPRTGELKGVTVNE